MMMVAVRISFADLTTLSAKIFFRTFDTPHSWPMRKFLAENANVTYRKFSTAKIYNIIARLATSCLTLRFIFISTWRLSLG